MRTSNSQWVIAEVIEKIRIMTEFHTTIDKPWCFMHDSSHLGFKVFSSDFVCVCVCSVAPPFVFMVYVKWLSWYDNF